MEFLLGTGICTEISNFFSLYTACKILPFCNCNASLDTEISHYTEIVIILVLYKPMANSDLFLHPILLLDAFTCLFTPSKNQFCTIECRMFTFCSTFCIPLTKVQTFFFSFFNSPPFLSFLSPHLLPFLLLPFLPCIHSALQIFENNS